MWATGSPLSVLLSLGLEIGWCKAPVSALKTCDAVKNPLSLVAIFSIAIALIVPTVVISDQSCTITDKCDAIIDKQNLLATSL